MTETCIHCGLCTKGCSFLSKYTLDLAAFAGHPELAYHCFLCGDCAAVCPKKLDGRQIALNLRREQTRTNGGKPAEPGYGALIAEKKNYIFRNYRHTAGKTALFPGCNFASFFPQTTDALVKLFRDAGIGVVYDCCGKPIGDLGMEHGEVCIAESMSGRLKQAGIERLIVLCPNCYQYLSEHLDVEIVSIYEVLREMMPDKTMDGSEAYIFLPRPDRKARTLFHQITYFLPGAAPVEGVQCCGLGGCAAAKEPDLAAEFARQLQKISDSTLYTYCASCTGQLHRSGTENAVHILTELLGTHEKPALSGVQSLLNRAKRIF